MPDALMIEVDSQTGDNVVVTRVGDAFRIQVEEPWAGSTDEGFGRSCALYITHDQARELIAWLSARLEAKAT